MITLFIEHSMEGYWIVRVQGARGKALEYPHQHVARSDAELKQLVVDLAKEGCPKALPPL